MISEVKSFSLPQRYEILRKEDILPDHKQFKGYLTQQYFKLISHRFIDQSIYLVLDDDFVFLRPTSDNHFLVGEKPVWFFTTWERAGKAAMIFKDATEQWLQLPLPYCLMHTPVYILRREILVAMEARLPIQSILTIDHFSEYMAYAGYAFAHFRDSYCWIDAFWGDEAIACRINQVPPTYLTLDASVQFEDYSQFNYVAFWSHWIHCEAKQREFFEASK